MQKRRLKLPLVGAASLVAAAGIAILMAQPAASIKRTVLLKQDSTVPGREIVMALVELPPGGSEGRPTHPAEVYGYVLEGTPTVTIEGQPAKTYKAGEVFMIPPNTIHEGTNKGTATVKISAVFFAEKGKPLTTPVQ